MTEAEAIVLSLKEFTMEEPPARRGILPLEAGKQHSLQKESISANTLTLKDEPQRHKRMNMCSFRPLTLWQFVIVATGN